MACAAKSCLWKPESIRFFAGEGRKPIDIVGYLKDQNHPQYELMGSRKRLEFPADVYLPNEASRSIIENAVIDAAATVDVQLIKKGPARQKNHFATLLVCNQSAPYYDSRQNAWNSTNSARTETTEQTNAKDASSPHDDDDNWINSGTATKNHKKPRA